MAVEKKVQEADVTTALRLADGEPLAELTARVDSSLMMDPRAFEHIQRVAKVYAASDMVPKQFQDNIANCVIALELAHRLGVSVFMLMQASYVVHGRPGLEAKLAIALCNERGPFRGPIQHRYARDGKNNITACTAYAQHKNGETCEATITSEVVKAEGWLDKPGSKWKTMPEQMYAYRASVFLIRRVCPEVIMGLHTVDELEDTYGSTRYVESVSSPARGAAGLANRIIKGDGGEGSADPIAGEVADAPERPGASNTLTEDEQSFLEGLE